MTNPGSPGWALFKRSKLQRSIIENFQFIDGARAPGEFQPEGGEARPAAAPRQQFQRPAGGRPMAAPVAAPVHPDMGSQIGPDDDGPPPGVGEGDIPF